MIFGVMVNPEYRKGKTNRVRKNDPAGRLTSYAFIQANADKFDGHLFGCFTGEFVHLRQSHFHDFFGNFNLALPFDNLHLPV